ncbi:MAG: hypothetical protein H6601_08690 [Flavobacteriales bacterium]|nr:hypothetical protein [Flavobacteriales bacterium]
MRKALHVFTLALIVLVGASSCKKNRDAKAIVSVVKDSVNFVTGDTVQVAAVQAIVRFYLDQVGAEHIDTNIFTDTKGKAEFVWFEDAIIQYDVTYGSYQNLENYIILEQGETKEVTVNVND